MPVCIVLHAIDARKGCKMMHKLCLIRPVPMKATASHTHLGTKICCNVGCTLYFEVCGRLDLVTLRPPVVPPTRRPHSLT